MDRRIASSVRIKAAIEAAIEAAMLNGLEDSDRLNKHDRLGARLVLQRAIGDALRAFLGRARFERSPEAARRHPDRCLVKLRPRSHDQSRHDPPLRIAATLASAVYRRTRHRVSCAA